MEISLVIANKLLSMLLMLAAGFVIVKIGLVKTSDSKPLSKLIVYLWIPCMCLHSLQVDLNRGEIRAFAALTVFCAIVQVAWIVGVRLVRKPLHLDEIDETSLIYTNCGNLIMPLILMTLGEEWVIYSMAYQISFNILLWSHGASTIRGAKGVEWKKILLNPNILCIAAGLVMMVTGFKLPEVIDTTLASFGAIVGPVSMLVIGMVIAQYDLKKVFTNVHAYLVTLGRLVILPALTMLVLCLTGFLSTRPEYVDPFMIGFLAIAAPTAGAVSQIAVIYDKNAGEAGIINVLTSILCIFTMPLMILLYTVLFK
ncbi:MAG: AEC family transporter [Eubacterium sp.]|nr:AEC family transporter [Eubacterium sp.]